jgi:hypothetical protein
VPLVSHNKTYEDKFILRFSRFIYRMFNIVYVYKRHSLIDEKVLQYFIENCPIIPFVSYYIVANQSMALPRHIKCINSLGGRDQITVGCLLDNSTFGPISPEWLNKLNSNYIKKFFVPLVYSYPDLFPRTFIGSDSAPRFSLPYNGIYIVAPQKPIALPYSSNFVDMSSLSQHNHLLHKPKYTFFMPYYDEPVYEYYGPYYQFLKPIRLNPPTVYFESEVFRHIRSVPDTDYIGILTFAFPRKIRHNLEQLITRLNLLCNGNVKDIIALYCPDKRELIQFATESHGSAFLTLWRYILTQLNLPEQKIP